MSIGLEKTEATAEAVPPTRASNAVDLPESLLCSIPGSAEKAAAMEGRRTKRDGVVRSWVAERNDAANARKGRGRLAFSGRVCEAVRCVRPVSVDLSREPCLPCGVPLSHGRNTYRHSRARAQPRAHSYTHGSLSRVRARTVIRLSLQPSLIMCARPPGPNPADAPIAALRRVARPVEPSPASCHPNKGEGAAGSGCGLGRGRSCGVLV